MAGASLLTLLDDIATVLDDVAVMSKMAAKKTAGVLGDDLALNAQQVSGVAAERELPIVWSVAKGSFRNKLILVPSALLLSSIFPGLIMPLLVIGGLFLCFEGAEKILEKLFPHDENTEYSLADSANSVVEFEQKKIAGAIRTDFILSAEIIVIALGTVKGQLMTTHILVLSLIDVLMTVGVYGLVACIVKLDDLGFYLKRRSQSEGVLFLVGQGLISFAPKLMKFLTVAGTIAMFLVGGGIIVHNIPLIHHWIEPIILDIPNLAIAQAFLPSIMNGLVGLIAGFITVGVVALAIRIKGVIN